MIFIRTTGIDLYLTDTASPVYRPHAACALVKSEPKRAVQRRGLNTAETGCQPRLFFCSKKDAT
jgi:hypothetical protein